jgi:hypothetical protein
MKVQKKIVFLSLVCLSTVVVAGSAPRRAAVRSFREATRASALRPVESMVYTQPVKRMRPGEVELKPKITTKVLSPKTTSKIVYSDALVVRDPKRPLLVEDTPELLPHEAQEAYYGDLVRRSGVRVPSSPPSKKELPQRELRVLQLICIIKKNQQKKLQDLSRQWPRNTR